MKKAYIIHRWSGTPKSDWYPWLKTELENRGYEVLIPQMPNNDNPIIEERVSFLKDLVGVPNEDTLFIGHSIGAQTIMRYFETLPVETKVANVIFVAGWFKLGNLEDEETSEIAKPWIENPIDFEKIKKACSNISVLLSSNEPFNFVKENKEIFEQQLNAKVSVLENKGHFTEDDGVNELPEIFGTGI